MSGFLQLLFFIVAFNKLIDLSLYFFMAFEINIFAGH